MPTDDFETAVMQWRRKRNERLRNDEKSWFNLAGLYWLKDGDNTFGSDSSCAFVLPSGAPKKAGLFYFKDGNVTVVPGPGVKILCNGEKLPSRPLKDDQQEKPDYLYLGRFILVVIKRGESTLIRLWDKVSPVRKAFTELRFYHYNPALRLEAKYSGYAPFKLVQEKDIIGEVSDRQMIGYTTFDWQGKQFRLDAEDGGDGLFIAFRDQTNSRDTYAGGRYLLTEKPQDGWVVLDFNKAYNMPCAYTLYATCGLPTLDNRLPIPIEAGEKKYANDH